MSWVIRVIGIAGHVIREPNGESPAGRYVHAFDPDAYDGLGSAQLARHRTDARRFPSQADAIAYWQAQSTIRPFRADGQPNRPATSFTVEIMEETCDDTGPGTSPST